MIKARIAIFIMLSFFLIRNSSAQVDLKDSCAIREIQPEFPGGSINLLRFIHNYIMDSVKVWKDCTEGRVKVKIVIDSTGRAGNAIILESLTPETDSITLLLIDAMPLWEPALQFCKPVNVYYTIPITFQGDECEAEVKKNKKKNKNN